MTGFGLARGRMPIGATTANANAEGDAPEIEVTVRTVNHRYLKATIRLPDVFLPFERELEALIRNEIKRGALVCAIRVRGSGVLGPVSIDLARARQLGAQLKTLAADLALTPPTIDAVAALPGVVVTDVSAVADDDATLEFLKRLVGQALTALQEMRLHEGHALATDIGGRLQTIHRLAEQTENRSPVVVKDYQQRLVDRIRELLTTAPAHPDELDLSREVAMFADRSDITEEITRLKHHIRQFDQAMRKVGEAGRRLDFIAQEMLREANTIASKCNDAEIGGWVIEMKAEIDKIKEQVQNIE